LHRPILSSLLLFLFCSSRRPTGSILFPYTTLFRSTAIAALENGEIATDMARYLTDSEQVPSAVAAGVKLDKDGNVLGAGGILVQDRKSTRLNSSHVKSSYAVFCLKKKNSNVQRKRA